MEAGGAHFSLLLLQVWPQETLLLQVRLEDFQGLFEHLVVVLDVVSLDLNGTLTYFRQLKLSQRLNHWHDVTGY